MSDPIERLIRVEAREWARRVEGACEESLTLGEHGVRMGGPVGAWWVRPDPTVPYGTIYDQRESLR